MDYKILYIFINNIINGNDKNSKIKELKNILDIADEVIIYMYDDECDNIKDKKKINKTQNFYTLVNYRFRSSHHSTSIIRIKKWILQ